MTPAATLTAAATRLREAAEGATPSRWREEVGRIVAEDAGPQILNPDRQRGLGVIRLRADATYIALVDPTVGLAVSAWLREVSLMAQPTAGNPVFDREMKRALAVAEAILRGEGA